MIQCGLKSVYGSNKALIHLWGESQDCPAKILPEYCKGGKDLESKYFYEYFKKENVVPCCINFFFHSG